MAVGTFQVAYGVLQVVSGTLRMANPVLGGGGNEKALYFVKVRLLFFYYKILYFNPKGSENP